MNRIGIDLVEVREVEDSLARFGSRFTARVFTDAEVRDCAGDARRLAGRLAAKEAAVKALRPGPDDAAPPRQIEVVVSDEGPELVLHGETAELARTRGWLHAQVSISHTDCHAAAVVLVEMR